MLLDIIVAYLTMTIATAVTSYIVYFRPIMDPGSPRAERIGQTIGFLISAFIHTPKFMGALLFEDTAKMQKRFKREMDAGKTS